MALDLDISTWSDYKDAAAGHDGILTDFTGDVVIKPCTQAEIDFYETSHAYHPDFAAHMPTYMGSVHLAAPEESIKTGPAIARSPKLSRAPMLLPHPTSGASAHEPFFQPAAAVAQQKPSPPKTLPRNGASATTTTTTTSIPNAPARSAGPALKGNALETDMAVVLENIAAGCLRPNILDIKLGARLWADDAPAEKRARLDEVAAATTSGSLGFRIAGMRVWRGRPRGAVAPSERVGGMAVLSSGNGDGGGVGGGVADGYGGGGAVVVEDGEEEEGSVGYPANVDMSGSPTALQVELEGRTDPEAGYQVYDKWYGRNFNEITVKNAFDEFFLPADYVADIRARRHVVEKCVRELAALQARLEQVECRMYSASILVVYEGDNKALEAAIREERWPGSGGGGDAGTARASESRQTLTAAKLQTGDWGLPSRNNKYASTSTAASSSTSVTAAATPPPRATSNLAHNVERNDSDDDADDDDEELSDEETEQPKVSALKLIDFAHAKWTPGEGPDENLLHGVRSVRKILEELLASTNANGVTCDL
ncbi:MAG: hypothetical protein M1822_006180 [Bathelium mastoideum]|nr:MAG: hypothetical protein M1822_006180 [Bathelium mastoideum]